MKKIFAASLLKLMLTVFIISNCENGDGFCSDLSSDSSDSSSDSDVGASPPTKRRRVAKAMPPTKRLAQEHDVELIKGKGSKGAGGGPGGFFWRITYSGKSAGRVFINRIDEEPIGLHSSIQIFLNKVSQGKHVGRIAYRRACELSNYDVVYAYMSKRNIGSYRAALAAGFEERKMAGIVQRLMRWARK